MKQKPFIDQLNAETKEERLEAAKTLMGMIGSGEIVPAPSEGYINNHVHTTYSFSPYSPSKAVYMAVISGLATVGIIDHDAISGAHEFIRAGEVFGVATTIGFEIRTNWSDTPLKGKRINNSDQLSSAYICAHGIPHQNISKTDEFLQTIRGARHQRNRIMVDNINEIVKKLGIFMDYEQDVLPLSMAHCGGGVTERHLMFALAKKMILEYGRGETLTKALSGDLGVALDNNQKTYLSDTRNDVYEYDLLNVLKSSFISQVYVDADQNEMIPVQQAVAFIREIGAIPSYCYLGDVKESVTHDRRAQKYEDDYLEEVMQTAKEIGIAAIAYMPSRNTRAQLNRIMALCDKYGFMQICGEDINQPRQSFVCRQLMDPAFSHLIDAAWALVGHEKAATKNLQNGLFTDKKPLSHEQLEERIQKYMRIGILEV